MKPTRLLGLPAVVALALASCSSAPVTYAGPTPAPASPSPSGALIRALWVLSPVGLSLRDSPDPAGRAVATIPQGTQVTAAEFRAGKPGWYRVTFNGVTGWIADTDTHSSPPQALVTARAQLAYSNTAAHYYFLYPATWSIQEKGNDVEVIGAEVNTAPTPAPSGLGLREGTPPRLTVHFGPTIDQLGAVPTLSGANLDALDFEVGGFTTVKRTFTLSGGGYEGDAKVKYSADHAVLVTLRSPAQADLQVFTEVLESFGFSLTPGPSPSPPA